MLVLKEVEAGSEMVETQRDSPAAIARSVNLGPRMQLAERRLVQLRERRREVEESIRELIANRNDLNRTQADKAIIAAQKDSSKLHSEIRAVRVELAPLRAERGQRVTEALAAVRREAGGRIVAAIDELIDAATTLAEANQEIRRAAGDAPEVFLPNLGELRRMVQRLAGRDR